MNIEYEATFIKINKNEIKQKLKQIGAELVRPEFMQKRSVFHLPKGNEIRGGWLRLRDEGDKITLTLKIVDGEKIENQKEITLRVDNFIDAENFLIAIGCSKKAFQESLREIWKFKNVEIMIDEWPFLEPFIEIEGESEKDVKQVSEKLGFDYKNALFCSATTLYCMKYGFSEDVINNNTPRLCFNDKNPFL